MSTATLPSQDQDRLAEEVEEKLIDSLSKLWKPHRKKGLEVRHKMGQKLNK